MAFLRVVPLTVFPLIIYNLLAAGFLGYGGINYLNYDVISFSLASDALFHLKLSELIIAFALILLFVELIKATKFGAQTLLDHMISTVVFIVYLIEFISVFTAATPVFFLLTLIALLDVLAGIAISISSARRDVAFGPNL
ncbi:hypothetical protein [Polycladidibacter stylochi]|uniref:hypothetical protein n=1 Tax=Polycladidibacter stylochi TaxID=1807766 RepID=UPI00082E3494|nr:hypothetical protein [Pseudovibrio stylochi]